MRYSDIDQILQLWAGSRSLHVHTRHKDEEVRIMAVVDNMGDTYHLYAVPDPKDPGFPDSRLAVVGVSLFKRGSKNHHAFYRERLRFTYEQFVPLAEISAALDSAWQRVQEWIAEAGHSRTPV